LFKQLKKHLHFNVHVPLSENSVRGTGTHGTESIACRSTGTPSNTRLGLEPLGLAENATSKRTSEKALNKKLSKILTTMSQSGKHESGGVARRVVSHHDSFSVEYSHPTSMPSVLREWIHLKELADARQSQTLLSHKHGT
jgi:hypothetical protein